MLIKGQLGNPDTAEAQSIFFLQIIYNESLPKIKQALTLKNGQPQEVRIVTGFLGRGLYTGEKILVL